MNVDSDFHSHPVTYRKLFHLIIGNCFITCHLLIETTVERAPKFESSGDFLNHLVTTGLLIELYPMVPFVPLVLIAQSVYIRTASAWTPATVAEATPTFTAKARV